MTEIGLNTWYIVQLVLWDEPFGVVTSLVLLSTGSFYAGYVIGTRGGVGDTVEKILERLFFAFMCFVCILMVIFAVSLETDW
jgi:hypothetical protein